MSAVKVCHFCGKRSLKQKKIRGKYEKALIKSLKEMKVNNGKHFGGTAMTGANEKKFHKESLSGRFKFLDCFNDRPHMKKRHMEVFSIIANCRKRFSKKFATAKYHKRTAQICQSYTKRFPIYHAKNARLIYSGPKTDQGPPSPNPIFSIKSYIG